MQTPFTNINPATKLEAFTIIESITAMLLIMISFSVVMMVYFNMLQTDAFPVRLKANNVLDGIWIETQQQKRYLNESFMQEGFLIKKTLLSYNNESTNLPYQNVYQLTLEAFTPRQEKIATHYHLLQAAYAQD